MPLTLDVMILANYESFSTENYKLMVMNTNFFTS